MEVKKFEAPTLAEALQVVKKELGPEAVIISTKNIRSGFGLMNKSSVQVTAAIDPSSLEKKQRAERALNPDQLAALYTQKSRKIAESYDVLSGSRLTQQGRVRARQSAYEQEEASRAREVEAGPMLRAERPIEKLKAPITQRRYIDIKDDESPAERAGNHLQDRSEIDQQARYSKVQSGGVFPRVLALLIESGVTEEHVKRLGDELKALMIREQISDDESARMNMARILMSRLRVSKGLSERLRNPGNPRMITFVGPTGVGKTTTLAKIAAELVLQQNRRVTLVTTDTFKIAAVEQLQTYANILRLPLEVCPNAESLIQFAGTCDGDEVLLVDTAGYGPRDRQKLRELKETLHDVNMETHLCVSATTGARDVKEVVERFKGLDPNYIVVTKLDETLNYGNVFNISQSSSLPLSYFTMGQRVPEDIEVATKERVADLILDISEGGAGFGSGR